MINRERAVSPRAPSTSSAAPRAIASAVADSMVAPLAGEIALFETPEREYSDEEERRWRAEYRHGELVARRFSNLVLRGYRPVVHSELDWFDFEHPHKKAIQIQLWPDGRVVDRSPTTVKDGSRTIIAPDDDQLFNRFLANVPKPTELQRLSRMPLGEALWTTVALLMLFGLLSGASAILSAVWRSIKQG